MTIASTVASLIGTSADLASLTGFPITLIQWYRSEIAGQKALTIQSYLEHLRRSDNQELANRLEATKESQAQCLAEIAALIQIMEQGLEQLPGKVGDLVMQTLFDFEAHKVDTADLVFEKSYLDHVRERFGKLRTLGVREMKELKQELSIAYVSLNLTSKNESSEGHPPINAERHMMTNPHMTVQGPAGSGKTTLLHWVATRCADIDTANNPWVGGIPFIVPLRTLPEQSKGKPRGTDLGSYSIDPDIFTSVPPAGWLDRVLNAKRGVLLIDGVDEIPATQRATFWDWLSTWVTAHPGNRCYVTSRFVSDRDEIKSKSWSPPKGFVATQVREMTDDDVRVFVEKWHSAVSDTEVEPDEKRAIAKAGELLPRRLADPINRRVRELCRTPLLCALVCTLHWREEGYLPARRADLYEGCCKMLIEERDRKRDIMPPEGPLGKLSRTDKEMLLQRLAWSMMVNARSRNQRNEIDRDQAVRWIKPYLKACEDIECRRCEPDAVLDHLIERTGLLRVPSKGRIDFPHRTFQEYLAACAAGCFDDVGDLAKRSMNDQWHETIILAAGTPFGGVAFGNRLIEELVRRGEELRQERAQNLSLALALACLETGKQIRPDLEKRVLNHLSRLVPPRSWVSARHLVAAGDALLPHLRYDKVKPHGWRAVQLSAHAIARVGSHSATEMLLDPKGYGGDERHSVIAQIISCPDLNILRIPQVRAFLSEPEVSLEMSRYSLRRVDDLSPIADCTGIQRLDLSENQSVISFAPLAGLTSLKYLNVTRTKITDEDFTYLAGLRALCVLEAQNTRITDKGLAELRNLSNLKSLNLGATLLTGIGFAGFCGLNKLIRLSLTGSHLDDLGLTELKALTSIEDLYLGGTRVTDKGLGALGGLITLQSLSLGGTAVTDNGLAELQGLKALRSLFLRNSQVSDRGLAKLKGMNSLIRLDLANTQVTAKGVAELRSAMPQLQFLQHQVRLESKLPTSNSTAG